VPAASTLRLSPSAAPIPVTNAASNTAVPEEPAEEAAAELHAAEGILLTAHNVAAVAYGCGVDRRRRGGRSGGDGAIINSVAAGFSIRSIHCVTPRNAMHGLAPVCVLVLDGNPAPALGHGSEGQLLWPWGLIIQMSPGGSSDCRLYEGPTPAC
jgi:hypothetical protein